MRDHHSLIAWRVRRQAACDETPDGATEAGIRGIRQSASSMTGTIHAIA